MTLHRHRIDGLCHNFCCCFVFPSLLDSLIGAIELHNDRAFGCRRICFLLNLETLVTGPQKSGWVQPVDTEPRPEGSGAQLTKFADDDVNKNRY